MIEVEYFGDRATLRDMQWHSSNPSLQRLLRLFPYNRSWPGYAPSAEWSYALQVQEMLDKLKIITPFPPATDIEGAVN